MIVNVNPAAMAQATNAGVFSQTTDLIRNQFDTLTSIGNISSQFMESAKNLYERVHGHEVMRQVKAITNKVSSMFGVDVIRPLTTVSDFQRAQPTMQRFVMANPTIREMYLRFEADGYSDTYVNVYGNDIGQSHHDYRLVMDGALVEEEDELFFQVFYEEHEEHDPVRLTSQDIFDIRRSWNNLEVILARRDDDPTSVYCEKL